MNFKFPIGTKVRTTRSNGSTGWTPEALAARRWGAHGEVIRTHDSHGFVHVVMHDNGIEGYYEPGEVELFLEDEATYTPAERKEMIEKMTRASSRFYDAATDTGVHAFIEFAGLMNEFITVCQQAEKEGIPFYFANTHNGTTLPFQHYHAAYLAEKLNCIYGPSLLANEVLRRAFITTLFDGKYRLIPVEPPTVNMALEDSYNALDGG